MGGFLGAPLLRERLFSAIRREIVRTMRMYHKPSRVGLVQSYDPNKHAVKVQFQPEGTISGWIPLTAAAVGNQFGIVSAPNIKDQVEVNFQEGDHMVGRIMTRHFSLDADKPPQVQAGEHHFIHGSGSVIRMTQDGTLLIGGASTVSTGNIGGGQSGNFSTGGNQGQVANPNQQGSQQQPQKPNAKQLIQLNPDGSLQISSPNGLMNISAGTTMAVSAGTTMTISGGTTVTIQVGSVEIILDSSNISVKPGSSGIVYLGGTSGDPMDWVLTPSGPSTNVKARI